MRKIKDFKEDLKEKNENQSLFTRLTGKYLKITVSNKKEESPPPLHKKVKDKRRKSIKALESSINLEDSMRRLNIPKLDPLGRGENSDSESDPNNDDEDDYQDEFGISSPHDFDKFKFKSSAYTVKAVKRNNSNIGRSSPKNDLNIVNQKPG